MEKTTRSFVAGPATTVPCFSFQYNTTDIPALCLLYRYVHLAPEIQVAQLLYPYTPIPRSKQGCALCRSLTLGYNEDSEGEAPV